MDGSSHGGKPSIRPAVSVVMPSFEQAAYLQQAVNSVLEGSGDEVELIVADGGSSDGSAALLARLAERFPGRLTWRSEPDAGPADAVNKAVGQARAPLIGWLNSDDLYTPGAIQRALQHLTRHPGHVMVYGQGQHVDADGASIGRYPTLPPTTPLAAFADGCFICQPTVFFTRDAFLAQGGLDTGLRAAFDFDLWLRLFKAHPGAIGFVDEVLAHSRLHAGGITARFRERVALEALQVIRRHLGSPPGHWLLTHREELCAQQPFQPQAMDLRERFGALLAKAKPWLAQATVDELLASAEADWRLRLSHAHVHLALYPDGWAGDDLSLRVQQGARPVRAVRLACRHHAPGGGVLQIAAESARGVTERFTVYGNGEFEMILPIDPAPEATRLSYRIRTEGGFVPAEVEPGSTDRRRLAFRVEGVTPLY